MSENVTENVEKTVEVLEVELYIPEEVLKENEELRDYYNEKKKVLSYEIGAETTKELKDQIKELILNSSNSEVAIFNPVLAALSYIQSFKDIQYDKEKDNSQEYTDAKKKIGTFNTAIKNVAKTIKEPRQKYNKIVIEIEKLMLAESENVKNALDSNFKEYLDEKAEKAAAALARKNKAKDDKIEQLSEENTENVNKLNNQMKQTRILEVEKVISDVIVNTTIEIPKLNKDGLTTLRNTVLNKKLEAPDTEDVKFENTEITDFNQRYADAVLAAIAAIDLALKGLNDAEDKNSLEKKVAAFTIDDDDNPFEIADPQQNKEPEPVFVPQTDAEKLQLVVECLEKLWKSSALTIDTIRSLEFEDELLRKIQTKLSEQSVFEINNWVEKTFIWTKEKQTAYINFLNSSKNEI